MAEHQEFADEFCKSMTYFTQHSLEGGRNTLQVTDKGGGEGFNSGYKSESTS